MAFRMRFNRAKIFPSLKTFGFSTGTGEKQSQPEQYTPFITREPWIYQVDRIPDKVLSNHFLPAVITSESERQLYIPTEHSYKVKHIDTTKTTEESVSTFHLSNIKNEYFYVPVKRISFTKDDILSPKSNRQSNSVIFASCENLRKSVDIRKPNFCTRDPQSFKGKFESRLDPDHINLTSSQKFQSDAANERLHDLVLYSASTGGSEDSIRKDGPSPADLHDMKEILMTDVERMFSSRPDLSLVHHNVVLENNLYQKHTIRTGKAWYMFELCKLCVNSSVKRRVVVINVHVLDERGIIRIHWGYKSIKLSELVKSWAGLKPKIEVLEAFSYYHIGKDCLVHKLRIDRSIPESLKELTMTDKVQQLINTVTPRKQLAH